MLLKRTWDLTSALLDPMKVCQILNLKCIAPSLLEMLQLTTIHKSHLSSSKQLVAACPWMIYLLRSSRSRTAERCTVSRSRKRTYSIIIAVLAHLTHLLRPLRLRIKLITQPVSRIAIMLWSRAHLLLWVLCHRVPCPSSLTYNHSNRIIRPNLTWSNKNINSSNSSLSHRSNQLHFQRQSLVSCSHLQKLLSKKPIIKYPSLDSFLSKIIWKTPSYREKQVIHSLYRTWSTAITIVLIIYKEVIK